MLKYTALQNTTVLYSWPPDQGV